jgi:hypothetical protein
MAKPAGYPERRLGTVIGHLETEITVERVVPGTT